MVITENRRIEAVRVMLKFTKKLFWKELKTNQYAYTEITEGRKPVPSNWITHLNEKYNINPNWIILGKGDVLC
jgi:hypothetical protein